MRAAALREFSAVATLYVALELASSRWKLAMTAVRGQRSRQVTVVAGDLVDLMRQIARAKERFGLSGSAAVISCYEAGRDGFWLHRYLASQGVTNLVIDAASTRVDRRQRRAKTDRLDAEMLLRQLLEHKGGEGEVFRVVQAPSPQDEDARHLHRQLEVLKRDRSRVSSRIHSLAATQGMRLKINAQLPSELEQVRLWDGNALLPGLRQRLELEHRRWMELSEQIRDLETCRRQLLENAETVSAEKAQRLQKLRSLGPESSWCFSYEAFGFRRFDNARQVGAFVGLTPTPYNSGQSVREQGISKAGNVRMRWRAIELSWLWLRYQPDSKLSLWFQRRFGQGSQRHRRIGIVALARKLVIDLWRYLEQGIVPEGATLKS